MKYDMSAIMKRAWEIKREDSEYVFAACLKLAWAEAKVVERIADFEKMGFNRWTKGNFDRLYINADRLGLDCDYYKSGNICGATFEDEHISNSEARRMKSAKTYIDIKTGRLYSDNNTLLMAAQRLTGLHAA